MHREKKTENIAKQKQKKQHNWHQHNTDDGGQAMGEKSWYMYRSDEQVKQQARRWRKQAAIGVVKQTAMHFTTNWDWSLDFLVGSGYRYACVSWNLTSYSYITCDVTVMHDESAVGLLETNWR